MFQSLSVSMDNPQTDKFKKQFYSNTPACDWNDWRWQLRNRIQDLRGLERIFQLSEDEHRAITRLNGKLPIGMDYPLLRESSGEKKPFAWIALDKNSCPD